MAAMSGVGAVYRATRWRGPEPRGSKEKVSRAREGESLGRGERATLGAARVLLCGYSGVVIATVLARVAVRFRGSRGRAALLV